MEEIILSNSCINLIRRKDGKFIVAIITPHKQYRYDYPKVYKYIAPARRFFYEILGNVRGGY